jgi:hypothetical protein
MVTGSRTDLVLPEADDGGDWPIATARVRASIAHPHLTRTRIQRRGPRRALVTELCPAPTLAERIARSPLPVRDAGAVMADIAAAVEALAAHGMAPRALSPEAIHLHRTRGAILADAGVPPELVPRASVVSPAARRYLSPEEMRGEAPDPGSLVYSLGAILRDAVPANAPQPLRNVIEQATAENPDDRYSGPRAFAAATLASIPGVAPAAPSRAAPDGRPARPTRTRPQAERPSETRPESARLKQRPLRAANGNGRPPAVPRPRPTTHRLTASARRLRPSVRLRPSSLLRPSARWLRPSARGVRARAAKVALAAAALAPRVAVAPRVAGAPPVAVSALVRWPVVQVRHAAAAGAAVLVAISVAISVAVTEPDGSPAGPATTVRSAALALHLPPGWHATDPRGASTGPLRAPVVAEAPGGHARLVAGLARDHGRLRRLLDAVSAPGLVRHSDRLGELEVWRWSGVRLPGERPSRVFVGYTSRGPLVAACTPTPDARSGACGASLRTLRLVGARPVPLRSVELVQSRVHSTLRTLVAERIRSRHELASASYAEDQAKAATSIANSFGFASQTIASIPTSPGTMDLSGLATRLDQTAAAYRALSDALVSVDSAGYDVARREIGTREAALPEAVQAVELP